MSSPWTRSWVSWRAARGRLDPPDGPGHLGQGHHVGRVDHPDALGAHGDQPAGAHVAVGRHVVHAQPLGHLTEADRLVPGRHRVLH